MRIPKSTIDWTGDGRTRQQPPPNAIGAAPRPIRLGTAKIIAEEFTAKGESWHSAMGTTLWVVMDYCAANEIPYDLTVHAGPYGDIQGYTVKRTERFY